MSEYTNRLQEMMLSAGRDAHPCQGTRFAGSLRLGDTRRVRPSAPYQRFLTFCEYATYAVFLAGWLGAILVQL